MKKHINNLLKFTLVLFSLIAIIWAIKPSFVRATPVLETPELGTPHFYEFNKIEHVDENAKIEKLQIVIDTDKYIPKQHENIIEEMVTDTENNIESEQPNIQDTQPSAPEKQPESTPPSREDAPKDETPKNETPKEEKPNTSADYVGRFKIPAVGVNVACYSGSAQSIVDATDSAAYFYAHGHAIIADHKHQGFNAIKSATIGTKATLGSTEYKCVAKIKGHNTGYSLTDANGKVITNLYPGTLVTYTCNENWQNITIVFWECVDKDDSIDCSSGLHLWDDWEIAWETYDKNGNYYGWDKRVCKLCGEEDWVPRETPSENCPPPEITVPEEPVEPIPPENETEPPSEETTPPEDTTAPSEPANDNTAEEDTPTPTEPPLIEDTTSPTEETEPTTSDNVVEVIG